MSQAPGFAAHPEHRVDLVPGRQHVRMMFNGATVADSEKPLIVNETGYDPVLYIPEKDIRREYLTPSAYETHCPYKGEAHYWTLKVGDKSVENAVWSYPEPYDETEGLKGHYAFYTDKLDRVETVEKA
jgi:uncharacterized protein (DUF427 family)